MTCRRSANQRRSASILPLRDPVSIAAETIAASTSDRRPLSLTVGIASLLTCFGQMFRLRSQKRCSGCLLKKFEMTDAMMDAGQAYLDDRVSSLSGRFMLPATFNWHEFWTVINAADDRKCDRC